MGGYFYTEGEVVAEVPSGITSISVGRGFEWRPVHMTPDLQADTSFVITLERVFDMRNRGWFSGDVHVHTMHPPIAYSVSPEQMHLVARAEDLAIAWCLDQDYEFTGGPHPISTPDAILYYSTEYRNQTLGHVSLQGLKKIIDFSCCWPDEPAYPMLSHTHEAWNPQRDEGMVLSHPKTKSSLYEVGLWPASGFGRELPVLAAHGYLDALDIAAYTNEPDVYLVDWYRLLSCGFQIPASAGTDCSVARYRSKPPGGFRVYVKGEAGSGNSPGRWVQALTDGGTFVTNLPLIPRFEVNGVEAGGVLNISEPMVVDVSFRIESVLGLDEARIVRNGETAALIPLEADSEGTVIDTTIQLQIPESSWLALHVDGTTDHPHVVSPQLFAHTSAVHIPVDSVLVRKAADARRFVEWLDSLRVYVDEIKGNWESEEQRREVFRRIDIAKETFSKLSRPTPLLNGLPYVRTGKR